MLESILEKKNQKIKGNVLKLEKIAIIKRGYLFRERLGETEKGDYNIFLSSSINYEDFSINSDKLKKTNIPNFKDENLLLKKNDILFVLNGHKNISIIIKKVYGKMIPTSLFSIIRLKEDNIVLPEYLTWYINSLKSQNYFSKYALKRRNLSVINLSNLRTLNVFIPCIADQKRIIEINKFNLEQRKLSLNIAEKKYNIINNFLYNLFN